LPTDRIVGLDIGTSKVRAVAADFDFGRLVKVAGVGDSCSAGVESGAIVDIDAASKSIARALSSLRKNVPACDTRRIVVGISGKQIASLNSNAVMAVTRSSRRITAEDVSRIIEQAKVIVLPPDRDIIHCIPRSFRVDGQEGVVQPIGMFGNRLELDSHLVTTTFSHTQNIESAVRLAGAEIRSFVVTSVASSEAALHVDELKLGVMLVDIGDAVSDIAIYMDGSVVYTSAIPSGGGAITHDLSAALRISPDDAERIKHKYGGASIDSLGDSEDPLFAVTEIGSGIRKSLSNLELGEIIQPRLEELLSLIRAELIKSGCYNLLAAGVVLTGGGSRLCGAAENSARVLRMPVRLGAPLVDELPSIYRIPEYSTGIGLTLFAASNAYNLRPKKRLDLAEALTRTRAFFSRVNELVD